jgi:hypothetical protein
MVGSCGLSYDLITIDKGLERGEYDYPSRSSISGNDLLSSVTQVIALLTTVWVLYNLFKGIGGTLWRRFFGSNHPQTPRGGGGGGGGPGFNGEEEGEVHLLHHPIRNQTRQHPRIHLELSLRLSHKVD